MGNMRFEALHSRILDVDKRLQAGKDATERDCRALKESLAKFQHDFDQEKHSRESLHDTRAKDLSSIDARLHQALEAEQHSRREAEAKVLSTFDEKTALLREEIAKEGRSRADAE